MLADIVGAQVATLRKRAGMTREDLSRATGDMGWPLTVDMLINIETRRLRKGQVKAREITVDELVVLARILDVPPILLLYPVGTADCVEVGNGETAPTWHAARWFVGEERLGGGSIEGDPGAAPVVLYRRHQTLVDEWIAAMRLRQATPATPNTEGPLEDAGRRAVFALTGLQRCRAEMERFRLIPPELPPFLKEQVEPDQTNPFAPVPPDSPTAATMRELGVWDEYAAKDRDHG